MADENESLSPEVDSDFQLRLIEDQTIAAGRAVHIDFSKYALVPDGDTITWSGKDFPESLTLDPKTGVLEGKAPEVELNQSELVSITIQRDKVGDTRTSFFQLEIIGAILLETPEGEAFFTGAQDLNFWDAAASVEIEKFIQQLINEHFVWIFVYDASNPPMTAGKLIETRIAKSGWMIKNFENVVMITPGDKAYEQYGNRARLLQTLREIYRTDVAGKGWESFNVDGSDLDNIGRAWIVAKQLDLPIDPDAPTDLARLNLDNINRLYDSFLQERPKPLP